MLVTLTQDAHGSPAGVLVDGEPLPLSPSLAVFNHSPSGFAWGYGGSGPAQLALALLLHAGVPDDLAARLHQDFKRDHVARWNEYEEGARLYDHEVDVIDWCVAHLVLLLTSELHVLLAHDDVGSRATLLRACVRAGWLSHDERAALGPLAGLFEALATLRGATVIV